MPLRRSPLARGGSRIAIAILCAATLAADVFVLTVRNRSTPVAVDEAVRRYRSGDPRATASARATGPPSARATASPGVPASGAPSPPTSRPSAPARQTGFDAPAEGVYEYDTSGYESISPFDDRHDYPEKSVATVRRGSGCNWELEHEVIEEHVDVYRYCATDGLHRSRGTTSEVEFFDQRDGATYRCDPMVVIVASADAVGSTRTGECESDESRARHEITNRGVVTIEIGGARVRAYRLYARSTLSGRVRGTAIIEMWVHSRTGQFLRMTREVDTDADSAFGEVHYRERARFVLRSLSPRT